MKKMTVTYEISAMDRKTGNKGFEYFERIDFPSNVELKELERKGLELAKELEEKFDIKPNFVEFRIKSVFDNGKLKYIL